MMTEHCALSTATWAMSFPFRIWPRQLPRQLAFQKSTCPLSKWNVGRTMMLQRPWPMAECPQSPILGHVVHLFHSHLSKDKSHVKRTDTKDLLADIFANPLPSETFERPRKKIIWCSQLLLARKLWISHAFCLLCLSQLWNIPRLISTHLDWDSNLWPLDSSRPQSQASVCGIWTAWLVVSPGASTDGHVCIPEAMTMTTRLGTQQCWFATVVICILHYAKSYRPFEVNWGIAIPLQACCQQLNLTMMFCLWEGVKEIESLMLWTQSQKESNGEPKRPSPLR